MLHREQLRQEAPALRRVAEAVDHRRRHVVDAEICRGGDAAGGQLLEHQGRIEPAEAAAARRLGDINAGEAQRSGAAQRFHREYRGFVPMRGIGEKLGFGELPRRIADCALFLGEVEIHGAMI